MSGAITIYRRELASLFLSPLAWILLLVALFVNGVFFIAFLSDSQGNVTTSLALMLGGGYTFWAFLVFFPPLLTMRLLSEEARSGTLEYLLTAPVSDGAVVVGKFLAATSFMAILWASVLVYALAVARLGVSPDWGTVFGGYLGAVLASGLFISIGMLASSLTSTPLVAAFLAFMACLLWLILPSLAELLLIQVRSLLAHWAGGIEAAQDWVRASLDKMNVLSHFQASFLPGVFDTGEVVFFLSWTALFVFLTTRMLEAREVADLSAVRSVGKGARFGILTQVAFTVVLALVATLLVNWLAGRPGIRQRFDLSATSQNTLSTAAVGVLDRLEEPVEIDVFYRGLEGPLARIGRDVMDRTYRLLILMVQEAGGRLEIHNNDLSDREAFDERRRALKVTGFENCLIVSRGERRTILRLSGDLAVIDPGRPKELGYRPPSILEFRAEEAIVQGILQVTRGEVPRVFATGHGERDLFSVDDDDQLGKLYQALIDDGFEVATWQFGADGAVPEDCAVLAIVGPVTAYDETELEAIQNYVDGGGRLVIAPPREPVDLQRSSVPELLDVYGLEISQGTVARPYIDARGVATQGSMLSAYHRIRLEGMARHVITDPLREGNREIVLVYTRELKVKKGGQPRSGTSLPLLRTAPGSWLDLIPNNFQHEPDTEELRPFDVCIVSSFQPPSKPGTVGALEERPESRIFAVGTSDVFANRVFDMNADFLRNVFNWAASREYRVSISPRNPDLRILPLGETDALASLTRLALWGLPGLCLLLGIFTAWRRSKGSPSSALRRSTSESAEARP